MTEINYVIEGGRERCAVRSPSGWLCQLPDGHRELHTINYSEAPDPVMYRRANGHDYKQASQPAEPERPVERAGWPDQAAQAENETDQPALLDLVRQYGDAREAAGLAIGDDPEEMHRRAEAAAVLRDRIAALVPQQPDAPTFLAAVNKLTIERDAARAELHGHLDSVDRLAGELNDARAEVERYARLLKTQASNFAAANESTAQSDPSVLSLPQVPPGTVALVGREHRWVRSYDGKWRLGAAGHGAPGLPLVEVLRIEGSVTVVKREPRTWPLIDGAPDGVQAVKGASGKVWRRSDGVTEPPLWCWEDESYNRHGFHPFALVQHVDGPLTEVFDDEPGGAP